MGTRMVTNVFRHEDFRLTYNDVCLLKVDKPFIFDNPEVQPAKLGKQGQEFTGMATVSGWGEIDGKKKTDILMEVTTPIIPDFECKRRYDPSWPYWPTIKEFQICAGAPGQTACFGDSGGPLVDSNGFHCGVVTGGLECGHLFLPGVFAQSSYYVDWINDKINKN